MVMRLAMRRRSESKTEYYSLDVDELMSYNLIAQLA